MVKNNTYPQAEYTITPREMLILCVLDFSTIFPLEACGLEGRVVNDLWTYGGSLYAATDSGVFNDTLTWHSDIYPAQHGISRKMNLLR